MPLVTTAAPDPHNPWIEAASRRTRSPRAVDRGRGTSPRQVEAPIVDRTATRPNKPTHVAKTASDDAVISKKVRPKSVGQMALPSGFVHRADGIYYIDKGSSSSPNFVCANFIADAQTRDDQNKAWGLALSWLDDDNHRHTFAMAMSMLAGEGNELRATLLDGGFRIATSRNGRSAFIELISKLKVTTRARAVDKVGWTDRAFVLPGHTIGDTPENRVIFQGSESVDHSYRSRGSLTDWQENVGRYAVGNSRLAITIAAAFVGPLLVLIGEEGGGINLRGPSSIGKSTALFACGSVWGPASYVRQWRATTNGLEAVCLQHTQTVLCLDEVAQLDPRDAAQAAYMIANGMGKARATRAGLLRSPASWNVMFVSSGEISLADLAGRDARGSKRSAAGQEVRILDFEADAGAGLGLFETLHDADSAEALARTIKDGIGSAYGVAGPTYVERMIEEMDGLPIRIKAAIDRFAAEHVPTTASGQVARAARRFGMIAAAGELAVDLGVLPWPRGEATKAAGVVFRQWLTSRGGGTGAAEDRDAVAKVRAFLEMHGSSRFESFTADEDNIRINHRAGFWRDREGGREYLVLSEAWKNEVCAGMDSKRVATVLGDRNLLLRDSAGKNSITATLPGLGKTRCYAVKASIFDDELTG